MKKILLIVIAFVTIFTTGCWDMIEVNQRIYPYTLGMDLNDKGKEKFTFTYTYPNIYALGKNPTQDDKINVVSGVGNSIFDVALDLGTRVQYPIYNKHLKVLILSDEVAKDEKLVIQIMDGINRDYLMNKMLQIAVINGKTEDFIKYGIKNAKRQEAVGGTIYSLLLNEQRSTSFTPKTASNFIEDMDMNNVSITPLLVALDKEIQVSGGAIFKYFKLIGYINSTENRSIAILNDVVKDDEIQIEFRGNSLATFASNFTTKRKLISKEENLNILFSVEVETQIHEYVLSDEGEVDKIEVIHDMEKAIEDELKKCLYMTIEKLQKEYNADAIRVGDYLMKFHPKIWKDIEPDWDNIFPDIEITVEVDVKIRRIGLTN